ncbi:MAG: CPBP family intramembrane glutamic endopeptidase [Candidatus Sumerlaeaceae bacterium]
MLQIGLRIALELYVRAVHPDGPVDSAAHYFAYIAPVTVVITFALSYFYVCVKYRRSFLEAFYITPVSVRGMLRYVSLGVGVCGIAIFALAIAAQFAPKSLGGTSKVSRALQNPAGAYVWMLTALIAPLVEELFYRGFAFDVLRRRFNTRSAVLLVTAWFAAAHISQVAGDWPSLVGITVLSAVVTTLRARTQSLTPAIIVHFAYNLLLVCLSWYARSRGT